MIEPKAGTTEREHEEGERVEDENEEINRDRQYLFVVHVGAGHVVDSCI